MKYDGKELVEMTPEDWDGKSREMLVWCDGTTEPSKFIVIGYDPTEKGWIDTETLGWWAHCADIPKEESPETTEYLKVKIKSLKYAIKKLDECWTAEIKANGKLKAENKNLKEEIAGLKEDNERLKNELDERIKNELRKQIKKKWTSYMRKGI